MDLQQILGELESKFGGSLDTNKAAALLKGMDLKNLSFDEIVEKIKASNLVGDLDGDGKVESIGEELKGKAQQMFGSFFGK